MEYQILESRWASILAGKVQQAGRLGWKPTGGLVTTTEIGTPTICQAMIRTRGWRWRLKLRRLMRRVQQKIQRRRFTAMVAEFNRAIVEMCKKERGDV